MINAPILWAILLALTLEFCVRQHSYYFLLYSAIPIILYGFTTQNKHCATTSDGITRRHTSSQHEITSQVSDLDNLLQQWRELGSPYYLHCDYRLVSILHRAFQLDGDTSLVDVVNRLLQYVEPQNQTKSQKELNSMKDKVRKMYCKAISRVPSIQEYLFPYIRNYIE